MLAVTLCPDYSSLVGMRGFEPPRIAPYAPEAYAYTNSATCPNIVGMPRIPKQSSLCLLRDRSNLRHKHLYPVVIFGIVGVSGIEPELQTPHACVLPLYYTPKIYFWGHACVLPLYYIPVFYYVFLFLFENQAY